MPSSLVVISLSLCFVNHLAEVIANAEPTEFTLEIFFINTDGICPGENRAISNRSVLFSYNFIDNNMNYSVDEASTVDYGDLSERLLMEQQVFDFNGTSMDNKKNYTNNTIAVEILLIQNEHGGGKCNCVDVMFFSNNNSNNSEPQPLFDYPLCGGNASQPRAVLIVCDLVNETCFASMVEEELKSLPFNTNCNINNTFSSYIEVTFTIIFNCNDTEDRNIIDSFKNGVEFAVRLSSMPDEWIPLTLLYSSDNFTDSEMDRDESETITEGNTNTSFNEDTFNDSTIVLIRGYRVVPRAIPIENMNDNNITLRICNFSNNESFQFRWLQTSNLDLSTEENDEMWALNNINITLVNEDSNRSISFDELDPENFPLESIRNGNVSIFCNGTEEISLVFGGEEMFFNESAMIVSSRSLLTPWFNITLETATMTTAYMTTQNPSTTNPSSEMNRIRQTLDVIAENLEGQDVDGFEAARELSDVINPSTLLSLKYNRSFLELILDTEDSIIRSSSLQNNSKNALITGVTVLNIVDVLLFNYFPTNMTLVRNNIGLYKQKLNISEQLLLSDVTIDSYNIMEFSGDHIIVKLPKELLEKIGNSEFIQELINITAAFFKNITAPFSRELARINESSLASDVVSVSLQCGTISCPTNNVTLKSNVSITFEHSPTLTGQLEKNNSLETVCVFLDIQRVERNSSLFTGNWLRRGCFKAENLSTNSVTICECNHLTHFAILLSSKPPTFSRQVELSLQFIGYIGVGISVVAMGITVFIFIAVKSLRNMRNYIHINLCINLAIAQITFVAGIDKTGPSNNMGVPIHCQVVAVLLHYFFLVSFMWMLMEGVVLYVALVRVFVVHKKRYIAAFTATSYGFPLLYMGCICLPLGFYDSVKYGYSRACFLRHDNYFLWFFIAPVIVIFLANIGFFIMASVIMRRHQMKLTDQSKIKDTQSWLKGLISLVVIMGLTWIMGLVIIDVDALLPLAYIFTIFVAFQGLFIFFIFIVFSKVVREALWKLWRICVNESDFLNEHFGTSHSKSSMGRNGQFTKSSKLLSESNPSLSKLQIERIGEQGDMLKKSESSHTRLSIDTQRTYLSMELQTSKFDNHSAEDDNEEWPEFVLPNNDSKTRAVESSASFPIN